MNEKGVISKKQPNKKGPTGNNYVLAISIDAYQHAPPLSNCVRDAKRFIEILTKKYDFEEKKGNLKLITHIENKDATRKNILRQLTTLKNKVTPNDNLIIYFSGHGETEDNTGFWIPVEAHPEEEDEFISTDEIKRKLNAINSFHTFLLVDACFSGSLFSTHKSIRKGVATKKSRWGLAASHSREVALDGRAGENSPFAKSLLNILENSTEDLSIHDLSNSLIKEVTENTEQRQTPVFQPLNVTGHELGQYVFCLKVDKEAELIATFNLDLKEGKNYITTGQIRKAKRYLTGLLIDVKEEIENHVVREKLIAEIEKQVEICENIPKYQAIIEQYLLPKQDDAQLDLLKKEIVQKKSELSSLKADLDNAQKEIEQQQKEEDQLKRTIQENVLIISDLQREIEQKDKQITTLENAKKRAQENLKKARLKIKDLEKKSTVIETKSAEAKRKATLAALKKSSLNFRDLIDGIPIEMIPVKGGKFKLGGEVELDDFYVGKYPVTQELWEAVMGNNPAYFKNNPKNPVERVSWEDTQDFIKKLNQKTGKNYRLLTEAEWEYAARGGSKSKGFEYAGSNNIGEVAWYFGNSKNQTQKVGQKKANELGIHDMNGNVWEWCQDWYGDYMKFSQINPLGPKNGATRVLRGGGWGNNAIRCQILLRNKRKPSYHDDIIGLRLAHN